MATLTGDSGNNTLTGTSSDDTISGLAGDDILNGGDGNDTLKGGAGADALKGGSGSDTASYAGSVAVNVDLKTGITSGGDAVGDTFTSIENLTGSSNADTLTGDDGDNVIFGGSHNDILDGGKGADTLEGGTGTDTVTYAKSDSAVHVIFDERAYGNGYGLGGDAQGDNYIWIDKVIGSDFNDTFTGIKSTVTFSGGKGNDTYEISNTSFTVIEANGEGDNDTVRTSINYTLSDYVETLEYTGTGDFTGTGNDQNNTIVGGSGNDTLIGNGGADKLDGGSGSDTASYEKSAAVNINLKTGAKSGGDAVGDEFTSIENLTGSIYKDTLTGDDGNNVIDGGGSDDVLEGGKGADTLIGGANTDTASYAGSDAAVQINLVTGIHTGGDAKGDTFTTIEKIAGSDFGDTFTASSSITFEGGEGDDTYVVCSTSVIVSEAADEGSDTVRTSIDYTLTNNVENLVYTGSNNFIGTGNALNNTITGGTGNDTLIGSGGADKLEGGLGSDTASYYGSNGVSVSLASSIGATGDAIGDTFDRIENLTGSSTTDTLTGDDGDNVISGGNGNDTLDGGKGADTLDGGVGGGDTVTYAKSDTAVHVIFDERDNGNGYGLGGDAQGDDYLLIEKVIGSDFNDTFTGIKSTVTFSGGKGNDTYEISDTSFTVIEANGEGDNDTVRTSINYTLSDYVETLEYTGTGDFTGTGNDQNNTIVGGSGNDTLIGNGGADKLDGGSGSDTAKYGGSAAVNINLKTNLATGGEAAGDKFFSVENLTGSSNADTLTGDDNNNVFNGDKGNDTLEGGKGADTLIGGYGDDTLVGGEGADTLTGGADTDTASYASSLAAIQINLITGTNTGGDAADDTLISIDKLIGSDFDDTFTANSRIAFAGGKGDDTYVVDSTSVTITEVADEGSDTVRASMDYTLSNNLENLVYTGPNNFTGTGNALNNTIIGGSGNDTLIGKAGADVLIGGSGSDTASYAGSAAVNVNLKTNLATGGEAADDTFSSVENLTGSSYADTLTGNDSNNVLNGGDGNDTLAGGKGADTLNGGNGSDTANYADSFAAIQINLVTGTHTGGDAADDTLSSIEGVIGSQYNDRFTSASTGTLSGGGGNDTYVVSQIATTTVLVEDAGAGTDTVETTLTSYTLKANFENLTHTDSTNFLGYGNSADNVIVSQGGVDKLYGYAGNDTIRGGSGGDTIDGGDGSDTASYSDSTAAVTINLSTKTISGGYATGDVFTSIENVEGSAYADTLTGDIGANVLSGGAGDDILIGGAGADTLNGGAGQDKITYEASSAAVKVDLSTGTATGGDAQGDKLSSIERVIGSSFNDTLIGSSAAEMLTGGAGDDILIGGGGNDVLNGGEGADVLDGGVGNYDTLNYSAATSAVMLDLTTGTGSGYAAGDTFTGIEAFTGSAYGDTYTGSTYAAEYNVGAGNDTVLAGSGAEKINGGTGTDTASYALSTAGVSVNLVTNVGSGGYAEGDQYSSIDVVVGSDYSDTFTSSTDKTLLGGLGDDTYDIGSSASTTTENADAGTDLVKTSSASYTLGDNLENLTYTGTANFTGSGNSADNVLTGGIGDDVLDGSTGNDALYGGEGSDVFVFNSSYGNDVVFDFQASSDTIDLTGMGFATVSDAAAYASEIEDGVLFNFGNGDTLTVHGLSYASLNGSDTLM
ncbi:calcium-binding protein [Agrobacterium vitis]|uniref:Calcium-binding protein n=1 Tax=Agrobacterium vitis TaxID=373 RepID=A0AAE2RHG5_AGRVI|nr:calcium-binding protein [Agrobacterium vitis]MBF2717579.1 hypothetical protein [Agrobacterium vitis]